MKNRYIRLLFVAFLLVLSTLFPAAVSAYAPDYWASSSVLANGKWVKIRVDSTGMQQLTHDQLREIGFPHPEKVSVWGYSGAMLNDDRFRNDIPDDLPQTPAIHLNNKLIFFGENHIHVDFDAKGRPIHTINPYTSAGYYFLTDSRPTLQPPTVDSPDSAYNRVAGQHTAVAVEEREVSIPSNSGAFWFDQPMTTQNPASHYNFSLNGIGDTSPVHIAYSWSKESGDPQSIELTTNLAPADEAVKESKQSTTKRFMWQTDSVQVSPGADVPDSIKLSFALKPPYQGLYTAMDWVRISFTADNNLDNRPQMLMHLPADTEYDAIKMEMPPEAQLWDITGYSPTVLQANKDNIFRIVNPAETHTLIAFNPEQQLFTPHIEYEVQSQNLHALPVPEMIIITAPELAEAADELASLHRETQNMNVAVATTLQICDEYGSGSLSAYALRRIVKHMSDKSPGTLRYVLLYGAGSYDNRSASPLCHVPTYQCHNRNYIDDEKLTYCTDAYYGMLGDTFTADAAHKTKPVVAVGRIPTDDIDQARSYTAKVRAFISSADVPAFHNTMLLSCDLGDKGEHSNFADGHATEFCEHMPWGIVHKVYSDMFPANPKKDDSPQARQCLFGHMTDGVGLLNYIGHGNPSSLVSKEGCEWFCIPHLSQLKSNHPFFAFLATCSSSSFDRYRNNIASKMLFLPQGGAIATLGNTRTAVSNYNNVLNSFFTKSYASLKPGATYGDLWLTALTETLGFYTLSNNANINTIGYVLFGDPAIQIPIPDMNISVASSADEVGPLQKFTVSGSIDNADFNGKATIYIYADSTEERLLGRHETSEAGKAITTNNRLLYSAGATITNGRFNHIVQLPESVFSDTIISAHLYVQALSESTSKIYALRPATAISDICRLKLLPAAPASGDHRPTTISQFHITGDSGEQQLPVGCPVVLNAIIDGGSTGLDLSQTSLLPGCRLYIDSRLQPDAIFTPDGEGAWHLEYAVASLFDGRHTATLTVTDCAGNTTSRSLKFIVKNDDAALQLTTTTRIARNNIEFNIDCSLANQTHLRLIITDTYGNTVSSTRLTPGQTAAEWNLRTTNGNIVAPGRYTAFIQATDNRLFTASEPVHFVVLP